MENYKVKTGVKIGLKTRNAIIDRFFDKAEELPNTITPVKELDTLQDVWNKNLFFCESSNYTLIISHHREREFIIYETLKEPKTNQRHDLGIF